MHQGGSTAPLRLQRGFRRADGRCELPILHTAGGLVGGDRLSLEVELAPAPLPGSASPATESTTDAPASSDPIEATLPPQSPPADFVEPTPPPAPDQLPQANPVGSDTETPQTA